MAMTKRKILDYKIVSNSSNAETFMNFIKGQIVPKTKKTLFMDNARIHHYKKFKSYVNSIKRKVIYNVLYMPIYNPIEYVFNSLKMYDPALPVRFEASPMPREASRRSRRDNIHSIISIN